MRERGKKAPGFGLRASESLQWNRRRTSVSMRLLVPGKKDPQDAMLVLIMGGRNMDKYSFLLRVLKILQKLLM